MPNTMNAWAAIQRGNASLLGGLVLFALATYGALARSKAAIFPVRQMPFSQAESGAPRDTDPATRSTGRTFRKRDAQEGSFFLEPLHFFRHLDPEEREALAED